MHKLSRLFYSVARRLVLVFHDPLVETDVAGTTLAIPLSHALPGYLEAYPHYASNLGRLAARIQAKYPDLAVIDIGANIGDSVAVLRREVDAPVLCIEGNPVFFKTLELNALRFRRVQTAAAYIGETRATVFADDKMLCGTGHLSLGGTREIRLQPLADIVAGHPDFSNAKLVKIDTDGFDCKIIRGSADFLSAARPALFFEYDPLLLSRQGDDGLSVFSLLLSLGYSSGVVYDNLGHYLLSLRLSDTRLLEELHAHFFSYRSERFGDFCVFPAEDRDVCESVARRETEYFSQPAPNAPPPPKRRSGRDTTRIMSERNSHGDPEK